jgi:hypothetical protein
MPSAKLPPSKPTELEALLAGVSSIEALSIIQKLCYNAACMVRQPPLLFQPLSLVSCGVLIDLLMGPYLQPKEEKYRRVKLTNAKIQQALVASAGAPEAMQGLGWVQEGEELVISSGKFMSMAQVREGGCRCGSSPRSCVLFCLAFHQQSGCNMLMALQVRTIDAALERLKKAEQEAERTKTILITRAAHATSVPI